MIVHKAHSALQIQDRLMLHLDLSAKKIKGDPFRTALESSCNCTAPMNSYATSNS